MCIRDRVRAEIGFSEIQNLLALLGNRDLAKCDVESLCSVSYTHLDVYKRQVGAYVAEIYRAGIQSIHWSQAAAARSLGLTHMQSLRFVILPQAVRHIIPPLLNAFIALQKDTALVTVVGVIDAFNQSMVIAANHYNLSAVTTVAVLFIVISIPQTRLVERMMQDVYKRQRLSALRKHSCRAISAHNADWQQSLRM